MSAAGAAAGRALLAATTRLGPVHLTVADLDRSIRFYEQVIGLRAERPAADRAGLGAGEDLVVLHERPDARRAPRHAGLFHLALLFSTRVDLAHALRRLLEARWPLQGASDHGVSEALYLADPDGNGIELYRDRPREDWPRRDGELAMVTAPLDVHDLLAEATPEPAARPRSDDATTMGHVHLHVGELEAAVAFHRDVVGFELMQRMADSAAFLSAGGYHHHLGLNTWAGVGAPPAPPDALGLRHWTVVLADEGERAGLRERLERAGAAPREQAGGLLARDPAGNAVLFTVGRDRAAPEEREPATA